jgi:hypothetical protein
VTGDQQGQAQDWMAGMRKASPAERKKMLDALPAERREGAKGFLKSQGIEVPD